MSSSNARSSSASCRRAPNCRAHGFSLIPSLLAPRRAPSFGKKMELYAGMVENMDFHVGRLMDYLKKIGEF